MNQSKKNSPKRTPLKKSVRFEVFKRDAFKCVYCGAAAPEAVLHVDHIQPVSKGGTNDIVNLATSCAACNLGKGAKELDDKSALVKQRKQLDELAERREQLEMMAAWRRSMNDMVDGSVALFEDEFRQLTGLGLNEYGRQSIRKLLRKYELNILLDGLDGACDSYLRKDDQGTATKQSAEKVLSMLSKVAWVKSQPPQVQDAYSLRGLARRHIYHLDEGEALGLIVKALEAGHSSGLVGSRIKTCGSMSQLRTEMEDLANG